MEAKIAAATGGRSRRRLSQELLAVYAWSSPEQGQVCDLSKVLEQTPAHARIGLALWLKDAGIREANRSDPEMNPERFPQRRSTRLMIPHTSGNSDRVLFTLRLPESCTVVKESSSLILSETAAEKDSKMPSTGVDRPALPVPSAAPYAVAVHGERRAPRDVPALPSAWDEATAEFAGVSAPAWIITQHDRPDPK